MVFRNHDGTFLTVAMDDVSIIFIDVILVLSYCHLRYAIIIFIIVILVLVYCELRSPLLALRASG